MSGDPVAANNGLFYIYSDHASTCDHRSPLSTSLGSTSVLSTAAGSEVANSTTRYLPFGGYRGTAPTQTITDRDFTGQKENRELGLLYYNARFYAPGLGRFLSADTVVPDPVNPQGWNRYAYTLNNPLKYTDPSGHCWGFASGLRDTFYGTTCSNLDMAATIVTSPDASIAQKIGAGGYIAAEAVAHTVAVGGTVVAGVGCLTGAGTMVCAGAGSAVTAASADGNPTNEIATASKAASNATSFFSKFSSGQGFSSATDVQTGQSSLLPSTNTLSGLETKVIEGTKWVSQYGGHAHVRDELISAGSKSNNIWGYVTNWTGNGLEITNWNSGTINTAIHNVRAVPIELRPQIVSFLSSQTGLNVIDKLKDIPQ